MDVRFLDVPPKRAADPRFMRMIGPSGLEAIHSAQGRLQCDAYVAYDADDPIGCHASLVGRHRAHTAQQTLCALEGDPLLWTRLVDHAETRSREAFALKVVRDLAVDVGDGSSDDGGQNRAEHGHQRQTTEFTCGPVALLDALRTSGRPAEGTRDEEIAIWREATLGVACDPYGLAVAAMKRGVVPHIRVSRTGPVLDPEGRRGILDRRLARDAQLAFEGDAHRLGCPVSVGAFSAEDVADVVRRGYVLMVLIDEYAMHGTVCPHWITVVECDSARRVMVVDDPWFDEVAGETVVDAYRIPIRMDDFDLMIHYDHPRSAQAFLGFPVIR
ncbi:peptidase C39 family protein [uncultured Bifidobacterium sp.]|uniref:peptidase C39 family protein n=1 Tax=uncultured Bifidobacterium sp. TaxID=165187 RepID=UPI0028DB5215|nr:peptidase C39 family protein [uncultured Bifidobacterium sp.]